jgi:hypothetical protein
MMMKRSDSMAQRRIVIHNYLPQYFVEEKTKKGGRWTRVFGLTKEQEPAVYVLGLEEPYPAEALTPESLTEMAAMA